MARSSKLARSGKTAPAVPSPVVQPSAAALLVAASGALCEATALVPLLLALRQRRPLIEHVAAVRLYLRAEGRTNDAARLEVQLARALATIENRRTEELKELRARLRALEGAA